MRLLSIDHGPKENESRLGLAFFVIGWITDLEFISVVLVVLVLCKVNQRGLDAAAATHGCHWIGVVVDAAAAAGGKRGCRHGRRHGTAQQQRSMRCGRKAAQP
ncbi:hypothetical protein NL676_033326 [Syzygium grande]|nr:hypothetical protein NL676_033326 [Syzygium grande]